MLQCVHAACVQEVKLSSLVVQAASGSDCMEVIKTMKKSDLEHEHVLYNGYQLHRQATC